MFRQNRLPAWAVVIVLASTPPATSRTIAECAPPKTSDQAAVIQYVGKRFHVPASDISIANTEKVSDSCFWELHLEAVNPQRTLTLFLSPDFHHLMPVLYDMNVDPIKAEKEEREGIMKLLNGRKSPETGQPNATVTIVEFSDFQCPFCKRFANTFMSLRRDDGSPNVKLIFKNFPSPRHSWANTAARIGRCVEKQNPSLFWRFHDYVFDNQASLTTENIREKAEALIGQDKGFNKNAFEVCIDDPATVADVEKDVQLGKQLGVSATPTLFVNGKRFDGAPSGPQLEDLIKEAKVGLTGLENAHP
jgi:protein-disulfide isomerase